MSFLPCLSAPALSFSPLSHPVSAWRAKPDRAPWSYLPQGKVPRGKCFLFCPAQKTVSRCHPTSRYSYRCILLLVVDNEWLFWP
ncbi:hypothetical protein CCHR01_09326 [Colletotrichum chrysophilum]|uniref:Uncharacterized protein n=1 Tax=Colletotrichum chrysophilum TaxID=1836956 RepID=A0AAD9EGX4_9PEZI|nr:hypothetical protein CCHR01_09326 [Colletotrichum chrysophilum]